MMMDATAKVSIGLPVYNGENFVAQAIESVLAQTYTNYELIISDNASTDKTQEICQRYAAQDSRIHYFRQEMNRGATWNFNHTFELASGAYFNWLAHDDLLAPNFLQSFVEIFDQSPETVLCFSKINIIDEKNNCIDQFDVALRTDSPKPSQRFYDLLMVWHDCLPVFGLIRASALKKTPLIGNYGLGDAVLLARLGLLGPFQKIDEPVFLSRRHPLQSNKKFNIWVDHHAYDRWFTTSRARKLNLPQWEVLHDLLSMVAHAKLGWLERVGCYLAVARWSIRYRKLLIKDCVIALRVLFSKASPLIES